VGCHVCPQQNKGGPGHDGGHDERGDEHPLGGVIAEPSHDPTIDAIGRRFFFSLA
jgi:hypothetical protein